MAEVALQTTKRPTKRKFTWHAIQNDFRLNKTLLLMFLPVLAYYIIFHYGPMYGLQIAFRDFKPRRGFFGSEWVGMKHFIDFFTGPYAWRLTRNTLALSIGQLIFGFPLPIIFALLLNEVQNRVFKRVTQTVTYLPYFISLVVVAGLLVNFLAKDGVINDIIAFFGGERKSWLQEESAFRTIYIASGIWQQLGWGSIIYLAAIAGIDQELYEAARIDGAGRFKQALHITIPGIAPTIIILLILRMGTLMNIGFEKVILLYNASTYETADVISSYVYRIGIIENDFSFSTAVGLFNSVINFGLILISNRLSRKFSGTSLW
ncbi:MAG: ABC transporter permease subunit [Bacillota bacterium]|nr:ABC transporter permease subunit [Bacillota bacterium]